MLPLRHAPQAHTNIFTGIHSATHVNISSAAGHITLKVAASRRSLHARAPACSAFARQAFVPCRVKIRLSNTLPSHYLLAACSGCARVCCHCRRRRHRDLRLATCPCRKSDSACPPHAASYTPLPQSISPPHRCAPRLKALFYALQRWPTTAIARSTRRITGSTILIARAGRRAALHHHALAAAGALGVFWHEPPADARVTSLQSRAQEWDAMRKRVVISHDTDECRSSDARAAGGDAASAADTGRQRRVPRCSRDASCVCVCRRWL